MKVKDFFGKTGMFVRVVRPDGTYFNFCDTFHMGFVPMSDSSHLDDVANNHIAYITRIDNDSHNVFSLSQEEMDDMPPYMLWDNYSPDYVMVTV